MTAPSSPATIEHRKRVLRHLEAQDPDGTWEIYWFGLRPDDWNVHWVATVLTPILQRGEE